MARMVFVRGVPVLAVFVSSLFLQGCIYRPLFSSRPSDSSKIYPFEDQAHSIQPVKLPPPLLEKTPEVQKELRDFGGGRMVQASLQRADKLMPVVKQIFSDEGVPHEMINVAVIESGCRPDAVSPSGAAGMWQFMKGTARNYGLEVSLLRDERKDPVLASLAAARHLRDLYGLYSDWHLALAAYNAGSGSINKALGRSQEKNFWALSRKGLLKRETSRFVSRFIAASLIAREHEMKTLQARELNAQAVQAVG